ncbi:MAG TPA: PfkB family carbohydrate kinase [Candidatus Limnocylindria bacterium]|nr:PfkB family carbohydrate kinase [Candidatus Limnocylindria bacterium]
MTGEPELDDLLIVGGLTIDRFADDRLESGGSVLHASRAAQRAGLKVSVVTLAGPEPVASEGVAELRAITHRLEVVDAHETILFRHRESSAGRRLWLERPGGSISMSPELVDSVRTGAVLFAPVAAELHPAALHTWDDSWRRGAILQGWLRSAGDDGSVSPIAPTELPDGLVTALASLDVLIASREDLLAAADAPDHQVRALRQRVGGGPTLIVTDGPEGVWIDDEDGAPRHLPVPWRVTGVPMVGAGDAFAALLLTRLRWSATRSELDAAAEMAMRGVAELLDARR